jgi:DNA-directed RNA polymerase subunit N
VASDYEKYKMRIARGEDPAQVMDDLGVTRYCCRRMLVSQVDIIDDAMPYT